ncbi:MAG: efflux RND transporter periplasmic adaptor subunit [Pseudomonadota bacterium]
MTNEHNTPAAPRPRLKRNLMLAAIFAALLIGGGFAAKRWYGKKSAAPVATVTVTSGDIEKTVTSLGKLKPKDYVDVGTQVSGQLKKVAVKIGDRVKKGDLIAEIDATTYATRVRTDRANIESLGAQMVQQQAEANLAKQQLSRNQGLLQERAISQQTVEGNQSALKVAEAKVAATRAQIKASQATLEGNIASLGYTRIYAPMAGTVVSQTSLEGQTVNSSQSAPVIVRVANMETMTVWAQVAEADVVKVKAGTPAYFATLGNPDQRWKGKVRQVMPTPETVNDVVLYNILVDVDNSDQQLMSDMTVQIFFVLEQAKDVPLVPLAALRQRPGKDPSMYSARVQTEQGIERRTVKVGVVSRTNASVVSGLAVGDKVVLPQVEAGAAPGAAPGAGGGGGGAGGRGRGGRQGGGAQL